MPAQPDHRTTTRAAYEADAVGWTERTYAREVGRAEDLRAITDGLIVDLGCGPGWHLPSLAPAIGLDLSHEMTKLAGTYGPVVQADLGALPFARESLSGAWASRSLVHLPRTDVPGALAELHRVLQVNATARVWLFEGDHEQVQWPDDSLPGRTFSYWPPELLTQTFVGAGFDIEVLDRFAGDNDLGQIIVTARRTWSLPDYVSGDMKLLICGLNPSPSSADSGVGFFKAGNRFWPAALAAGLVIRDRDPHHGLVHHGIGMTDMVKRPTRRADELDRTEYRVGLERLEKLVTWLQPQTICMVGLAGWRAAVDRKAQRGWQPQPLAGRPVYLMPSTSGLNAHDTVDTLADHLRTAARRP